MTRLKTNMGEVAPVEDLPLQAHFDSANSPDIPLQEIKTVSGDPQQDCSSDAPGSHPRHEGIPIESWLPITESRNGNSWSAVFHLLSSGIGIQALLLPYALSTLGWAWGIVGISVAFTWQLYTIWLLVQLHEPLPGTRYSRFMQLAKVAFGPTLGKILAIPPVMYLGGGACVIFVITGGGYLKRLLLLICEGGSTCDGNALTAAQCFMVFAFVAVVFCQAPNLHTVAWISFFGALIAVGYSTLVWALSVSKGRLSDDGALKAGEESDVDRMCTVLGAIGAILLSFRGHNLVLEIQGTLPSCPSNPPKKVMWRSVLISYIIIMSVVLFPVAIAGYWAYGNKVPYINGGMLRSFFQYHGHSTPKSVKILIYLLVILNCLTSFSIFSMPTCDNFELVYSSQKKQRAPRWFRIGIRLSFCCVICLLALAFPFLATLAPFVGGIMLPLTYAYPCFMWVLIKKPRGLERCFNLALGCLGIALCVLLVGAALRTLIVSGLDANFFNPKVK